MDGGLTLERQSCHPLVHAKREKIVRLLPVHKKSYAFIAVSQRGRVGLYDGKFVLRSAYSVNLDGNTDSTPATIRSSRSHRGWVTDALYMPDCRTLVVATSNRALHFYTTVVAPHAERFRVYGMKDIPISLAYAPGNETTEPMLCVGDDGGDVLVLRFLQASQSLFKNREAERVQKVFWKELQLQAGLISLLVLPVSHKRPVLQVSISPDLRFIYSCSRNPRLALAIRHIHAEHPPYFFTLPQGILCFEADPINGVVATGRPDGTVHLWTWVVSSKPLASLKGHTSPIVGLLIVKENFLVSVCERAELRLWDLQHELCLHCVPLYFPVFGMLGKRIEFAQIPLVIHRQVPGRLFVVCCDYVADMKSSLVPASDAKECEDFVEDESESTSQVKYVSEVEIPTYFTEDFYDIPAPEESQVFSRLLTSIQSSKPTPEVKDLFDLRFRKKLEENLKKNDAEKASLASLASKIQEVAKEACLGRVYEWENDSPFTDPPPVDLVPVHSLKCDKLAYLNRVKEHVRNGTPFCALTVHEPVPLQLPLNLPISNRMKSRGLTNAILAQPHELVKLNLDFGDDPWCGFSSTRSSMASHLASSLSSYYRHKHGLERRTDKKKSPSLFPALGTMTSGSRKSSVSSISVSVSSLGSEPGMYLSPI